MNRLEKTNKPAGLTDRIATITQAARIHRVTRQAIHIAIKQKKLKAAKVKTCWMIHLDDLEKYRKNKYSRTKSRYNGKLIFDNDKGYFSVTQVANMLNIPTQKIYYALRTGQLQAMRRRAAWVIHAKQIDAYKKSFLEEKIA